VLPRVVIVTLPRSAAWIVACSMPHPGPRRPVRGPGLRRRTWVSAPDLETYSDLGNEWSYGDSNSDLLHTCLVKPSATVAHLGRVGGSVRAVMAISKPVGVSCGCHIGCVTAGARLRRPALLGSSHVYGLMNYPTACWQLSDR
jgi:hypothetical protein